MSIRDHKKQILEDITELNEIIQHFYSGVLYGFRAVVVAVFSNETSIPNAPLELKRLHIEARSTDKSEIDIEVEGIENDKDKDKEDNS